MEEESGIEEMLGLTVQAARGESKDLLTVRLNPQNIERAVLNEDLKGKIAKSIGRMKEIAVNALQQEAAKNLQTLQSTPDSSLQESIASGKALQNANEAISQKLQTLANMQEQVRTDCEEQRKQVEEAQTRLVSYANQIAQRKTQFLANSTRKPVAPLYIRDCAFEGVVTRLLVINFKKGSLGDVYLKIVGDGVEELHPAVGIVRPGAQEIRVDEVVAFYNTATVVEYTLVRGNVGYWEVLSNSFSLQLKDQGVGEQAVIGNPPNSFPSQYSQASPAPSYGQFAGQYTDPLRQLAIRLRSHFTAQTEEEIYQWLQNYQHLTYEDIIAQYPST